MSNKAVAVSILGVGMAFVAAYLAVNGIKSVFLWVGVFLCFMSVVS